MSPLAAGLAPPARGEEPGAEAVPAGKARPGGAPGDAAPDAAEEAIRRARPS